MDLKKLNEMNELLSRIKEITATNSIHIHLKKNTPTLDLFEKIQHFHSSEKQFLVFKNSIFAYIDGKSKLLSLVVCSSETLCHDTPAFSMSYLKTKVPFLLRVNEPSQYKEEKLYYLSKCVNEVFSCNLSRGDVIAFKTPCMLKAQTNEDRYGFGNEWTGKGSYIIGKRYGSAETPFSIIGIVVES